LQVISELAAAGELVAEMGDGFGSGTPVVFGDDFDFFGCGDELLMEGDSFAEQVNRARGAGDHLLQCVEMGRLAHLPGGFGAVECGGEDLVSLGVEDDDDIIRIFRGIFDQHIHGRNGDEFSPGGVGERFGERDSNAKAGE
jgi:hypothetical protein